MELLSVETIIDLLGVTRQTVKNMVKRGDLVAEYPKVGKRGRPNMMITTSSYGKYLLNKENRKAGKIL